MNKIGNKEYALKRILLLLPLMLSASHSLAAADIKLNAEGKKLYQQLLHAADTNNCETVIITGFQFKQGYSAYLDSHPEANEKTEASIGKCIDALSAQDIPVKPASSLGIAESDGQ
jgi:hypothetical protein